MNISMPRIEKQTPEMGGPEIVYLFVCLDDSDYTVQLREVCLYL